MNQVASLRVVLDDISPPIWRRVEVPVDITWQRLHEIIQGLFFWKNKHLYEFEVGGRRIGIPEPGDSIVDASRSRFSKAVKDGIRSLKYLYDFGDGWECSIDIESVGEPAPKVAYPRCVDGARNSPPEDSGGPSAYQRVAEALRTGKVSRDLRERVDWFGRFDPEKFSVAIANLAMPAPRVRRHA